MSRTPSAGIAWQATAALTTLAAGFMADRAIRAAWRKGSGKPVPTDEDLLDTPVLQIVAFAAISGAIAGVVQQLSLRKAASWYGGADFNPLRPQTITAIED
ncbi:MAG: DUF4235 domain-containing protein [Actinomyces urogenitalis]|nr:DUF4235 domain-containing protein [Actinomyces urogenitalis]KGF05264.1 hypothetical protein HMPREF1626_00125 [Actinomyces urogenitalis S6-C4]MDU0972817.1 DUF4235 domain-containing protein [Actinomyces urogenitalis]MDU5873764.1 DUF4235 domain-containing protein [Actinomyces urogenitalis]MDU7428240.1 DUF4235 domain-containing protein [Actinomyces urogenitalis]